MEPVHRNQRGVLQEVVHPLAAALEEATRRALRTVDADPGGGLSTLIDLVATDILPALRVRMTAQCGGSLASDVDMKLSQAAEALSIVASDPRLRWGRAAGLRFARGHLQRLLDLAPELAKMEESFDATAADVIAEDRARSQLLFVAPPDRTPTEGYALRPNPRTPKVWSPGRPGRA